MAILARDRSVEEWPAAVLSRPPELLVQVGEVLAEGRLSVPDEGCLAEAWTDEVQNNSRTRYGDQACEITDRFDLQ